MIPADSSFGDWRTHAQAFACPECWDMDEIVAFGFGDGAYILWQRNQVEWQCPVCGYKEPSYRKEFGVSVESLWVRMFMPSIQVLARQRTVVREPTRNEIGEFCDEKTEHLSLNVRAEKARLRQAMSELEEEED